MRKPRGTQITQTTISKTFEVEHNGKTYYVDYLNSDGQTLSLINRDCFMVLNEDGEELDDHVSSDASNEEKAEAEKRREIIRELLLHVMAHFNDLDNELTKEFEEYREAVM